MVYTVYDADELLTDFMSISDAQVAQSNECYSRRAYQPNCSCQSVERHH